MPKEPLDILFVFPKFANGRSFEGFDYSLGAGFVRAMLERHGYKTGQFVHPGDATVDEIGDLILSQRPRMIGFSVYDINYYFVKLIAESIRRKKLDAVLICGGPTATFSPEIILSDCEAIDICVRSYGERAALELMEWRNQLRPLQSIPGLTYRDGGKVGATRSRSLEESLCGTRAPRDLGDHRNRHDEVRITVAGLKGTSQRESSDHSSLAKLDALDAFPDPYLNGLIPATRASDIGIVTSRGCTFPCTFCNFSAMSDRKISFHSIERVLQLLRFIETKVANGEISKDNGTRKLVAINDDNFSLHPRRFHDLLRRMAVETYEHIEFWAEMRTETLRPESFEMLKRAGFGEINFGMESGVPHVLAAIKKIRYHGSEADGFAVEKRFLDRIKWAVREGQSAGLSTSVSVILGNPGESFADGLATLEFVRALGVNRYAHNFLSVLAGTELASTYAQYGIVRKPSPGKALPFWTFPTYDVYALPILDNDQIWLPERGIEMVHVFHILSGAVFSDLGSSLEHRLKGTTEVASHIRHEAGCRTVPAIVLAENALSAKTLRWLRSDVPMAASVWIEHTGERTRAEFQQSLAAGEVAVQEVNTLRYTVHDEGSETIRVNELSPNAPPANTRTIHALPAASINLAALPQAASKSRNTILLKVDNARDVEALVEIVRAGAIQQRWTFSGAALRARLSLADGCRWCGTRCPASGGSRWFVDNSGQVSPCKSGRPVGNVGDSPDTLQQRAKILITEERARRGCGTCPVADSCSQCLFPSPIDTPKFCEVRKANPNFSTVFDGLSLARSLSNAGLLPRDVSNSLTRDGVLPKDGAGCEIRSLRNIEGQIVTSRGPIPLSKFILVTFEGDAGGFLFHAVRGLLIRLDAEHVAVICALAVPPATLVPSGPKKGIATVH